MGAPERLVEALGRPEDVRLMTGVCLAIGGNLLISVALNLTKHAHNKNQMAEHRKPYMHLWLWWLGFLATLVGEMGNFSAYGFAPASLIAPLGAVSVISNAFIASFFLGEGFRLRDLVGCALCIGGGVVIVLAGTSHPAAPDFKGFLYLVQDPVFLAYMACLSLVTALMLGFQDKYGDAHVSYYVLLCSMIGSVTVLACKGVSTMLNMWACCGGAVPFGQPVLYGLLFVLGATAVLQTRYLNIAMENFGNVETIPVFYVLFTLCTIVSSNFLYRDFQQQSAASIAAFCAGCGLTFLGVFLITSARHDERRSAPSRHGSKEEAAGGDAKRAALLASEAEATREAANRPAAEAGAGLGGRNGERRSPRGKAGPQPITLMNSPLRLGGEVLRRTLSLAWGGRHSPREDSTRGYGTEEHTPPTVPCRLSPEHGEAGLPWNA